MVQPLNDLVKIAGQAVERSTLAGLKVASAKSGVSFQYLVAKAAQESSLNPEAQASTSSAAGLFQFTRGTWLDMMHRYGSQYGYGDLANKISVSDSGKAMVKDAAAERRLLDLREDPEASGLMAAAYAQDNAASLEGSLGRLPDAADLYLAHFLGASGAAMLLNAAQENPDATGASVLPAAAKANRAVFYTQDGKPRSVTDVVDLVRERFGAQLDRFAGTGEGTPEAPAPAPRQQAAVQYVAHGASRVAEQKPDITKKMVQMMVMQEMAKMIAARPMQMLEDEEGGEQDAFSTLMSPAGFQGQDFAAAMMRTNEEAASVGLPKQKRGPSAYHPPAPPPVNLDDLL
ncbi:MAG: transglycosylase SLT domain-containing protein [Rhodospirillaceae bacterium]